MDIKKIAPVIVVCLLLAGCGGDEAEAKKAILACLKDPDSAKFGDFTQVGDKYICMTVNSKNSMGGYTGDQQAVAMKSEDEWHCVGVNDISQESCIEFANSRLHSDK